MKIILMRPSINIATDKTSNIIYILFIFITIITFNNCQLPEDELPTEEWEVESVEQRIALNGGGIISITLVQGEYLGSLYYADFDKNSFVNFSTLFSINGVALNELCSIAHIYSGDGSISIGIKTPITDTGENQYIEFDTDIWFYAGDIGEPEGLIVAKCRFVTKNALIVFK